MVQLCRKLVARDYGQICSVRVIISEYLNAAFDQSKSSIPESRGRRQNSSQPIQNLKPFTVFREFTTTVISKCHVFMCEVCECSSFVIVHGSHPLFLLQMLREVVAKTLNKHGISSEHKCFEACSQRLFDISKFYLKVGTNHSASFPRTLLSCL